MPRHATRCRRCPNEKVIALQNLGIGFAWQPTGRLLLSRRAHGDARPHDLLYWRRDEDYALRRGDWKLAYNDASCPQDAGVMLFDLASDPAESVNLAERHPEKVVQLEARIRAHEDQTH